MWQRVLFMDCIELLQKIRTSKLNTNINLLFWVTIFFASIFWLFKKLLNKVFARSKIIKIKRAATITLLWNICFFSTSVFFLSLYHNYFIQDALDHEIGKWFPKRESLLFYTACDALKFKIITLILSSFHIVSAFLDLKLRDFTKAISKLLYVNLLIVSCYFGFENYSVVLNINLGFYCIATDLLELVALHTDKNNETLFNTLLGIRLMSFGYIFINFLAFQYLIPTLYSKDFKLLLNISFFCFYISCIWSTNPFLTLIYHQIFHLSANDCIGENSIARCIMLKDSQEIRHYKNLQKAYLELRLSNEQYQLKSLNTGDSASSKAFQTIKCVMTLKRKLKRIRETRENLQQKKN